MKSKTAQRSTGSSVTDFEDRYFRPNLGRTLVVGSRVYPNRTDRRALYADAVGIDMLSGDGVDLVVNLEEPLPHGLGQFDHIDCLSVLEHSRRPWLLAANLERLMRGTIYVSAPFVWKVHAYPEDYFRFTPAGIRSLFPSVIWDAVLMAADVLTEGPKVSVLNPAGHPYFARTETVGFGRITARL